MPLHTPDEGEWVRGHFRIPYRYVRVVEGAAEHTNEALTLQNEMQARVKRWLDWKGRQGWFFVDGSLRYRGAFPPPSKDADTAEDEDEWDVYVDALFKRETPIYMPADLFEHRATEAQRYGVPLETTATIVNPLPEVSDEITHPKHAKPNFRASGRRAEIEGKLKLTVEDGQILGGDVEFEDETPSI